MERRRGHGMFAATWFVDPALCVTYSPKKDGERSSKTCAGEGGLRGAISCRITPRRFLVGIITVANCGMPPRERPAVARDATSLTIP